METLVLCAGRTLWLYSTFGDSSVIDKLRSELQAITQKHPTVHPLLVDELKKRYPHSISIVCDSQGQPLRVLASCYEHAFELTQFEGYEDISLCDYQEGLDRFIANSVFVRHLMEQGILREHSVPLEGALVLYFDNDKPVHAGLMKSASRVSSKWGSGHLWEHELWEVPSSYGDDVRFFERPDPREVFAAFKSWLPTQPGYSDFEAKYLK